MTICKCCVLLVFILIVILYSYLHRYMELYYKQQDPMIKKLVIRLQETFPEMIDLKIYKSDGKSFTINKKHIYLCLKDENDKYYHENMLIYVLLHEYAHVKNDDIGHTTNFHKKFNEILDKAIENKLYDPTIASIQNYCEHKESK